MMLLAMTLASWDRTPPTDIQIERRSTLPLAGMIWPRLKPPTLHEPFKPSRSGRQTGENEDSE
jgi:hypothetical protein